MSAYVLTDVQQVVVSLTTVDAAENPGKIDGTPQWSSSAPDILTVTPADNGMSAVIRTTGRLTAEGEAVQVSATADADLGAGVTTLTAVQEFAVSGSQAVSLGMAVGEPSLRDDLQPIA